MPTRRDFLKLSAFAGAAALMPARLYARRHIAPLSKKLTPGLSKYVDALTVPAVVSPQGLLDGVPYYEIAATEFYQGLHRDLPPTKVWGYGDASAASGSTPGPTMVAHHGSPIKVKFLNRLPATHLLPVDHTVMGTFDMDDQAYPDSRISTHLHGGHVPPRSDGNPEWWIAWDGTTGPEFNASLVFDYPNDQRGTLLWYHDHALGITRLNVYAGLAAAYVLRDGAEDDLLASGAIPGGEFEIPLIIQDRTLNADGSLFYPSEYDWAGNPPPEGSLPWPGGVSEVPEFFGDAAMVNGKIWPYLEVEPRAYRFRVLNGCSSRFLRMQLYRTDAAGTIHVRPAPATLNRRGAVINPPGPAMLQIGTEGGFLPSAVILNDPKDPRSLKLFVAPAERADLLIDFSQHRGENLVLWNDAVAPFPSGGDVDLGPIMQFRVKNSKPQPFAGAPALPAITALQAADATVTRELTLNENFDQYGRLLQQLGTRAAGPLNFEDPVTETPTIGATEIWKFYNLTMDAHPIHVHLINFQVVSRQAFDMAAFMDGQFVAAGPVLAPDANELGWKDTVKAYPGQPDATGENMLTGMVTTVIMRFDAPAEWRGGEYMWHCHILEHEDHNMMRRFVIG